MNSRSENEREREISTLAGHTYLFLSALMLLCSQAYTKALVVLSSLVVCSRFPQIQCCLLLAVVLVRARLNCFDGVCLRNFQDRVPPS